MRNCVTTFKLYCLLHDGSINLEMGCWGRVGNFTQKSSRTKDSGFFSLGLDVTFFV